MKYDFLVNGNVTLVLTPENMMEEELLKSLAKQDNEIIELRSAAHILNKTVKGVIITKRVAPAKTDTISDNPASDAAET